VVSPEQFAERCAVRPLVLDGGLASELARHGHDLSDPLWSARVLLDDPDAVERVHYDYYAAGADVAITASYQVTYEGLAARGLAADTTTALLRHSVTLADSARSRIQRERGASAAELLIAASVGPHGALLHDGSEYSGDYGLTVDALADFHRRRMEVLIASGPDLLACETIPSLDEARALVRVLRESPAATAWITFTARDGTHTAHGEPIAECAAELDTEPQIVGIGVNCVAPGLVTQLIGELRRSTRKPVVVYPNAGDAWDGARRVWVERASQPRIGDLACEWRTAGASAIGGCCRTTPADIAAVAATVRNGHISDSPSRSL
jgi:homocysteine S-methyltransferase